jgi:hypothetical protein
MGNQQGADKDFQLQNNFEYRNSYHKSLENPLNKNDRTQSLGSFKKGISQKIN